METGEPEEAANGSDAEPSKPAAASWVHLDNLKGEFSQVFKLSFLNSSTSEFVSLLFMEIKTPILEIRIAFLKMRALVIQKTLEIYLFL